MRQMFVPEKYIFSNYACCNWRMNIAGKAFLFFLPLINSATKGEKNS